MAATIPLGYAVPSGGPVTIPIGHMAVTGQTQAAGKTTTLEALATRSGRHVLAFTTKRGEGAFAQARTVPVYFREHADWRYVESILESVMRERMRKERAWVMRVSRGASTLQDVWSNVKAELKTATGYAADMYMMLDAYLQIVVPQIHELPLMVGSGVACWEPLSMGLNIMDLGPYRSELQALIIASCLEYVYEHCKDTIVVIPEAWEFIPLGRKSPATYAAEAFVRKGGTLKNYLWIDSQDLAGVHTPVLKQIHVWLLGVQREINEIKRTLAHLHGVQVKPKPDDIAQLGLGQFVACYGSHAVKTYVRPNWITSSMAQKIARGEAEPLPAPKLPPPTWKLEGHYFINEDAMDAKLKQDNEILTKENQLLKQEITELRQQIRDMGKDLGWTPEQSSTPPPLPERRAGTTPLRGRPLDDDGKIEFFKPGAPGSQSLEYELFKQRLLADADVLAAVAKILTNQPEIVIESRPKVLVFDGDTPKGRLAKMIADGLLDTPVKPGIIIKEFRRTGTEIHPSRLSTQLSEFVSNGFLLREGDLYVKSPTVKITTKELQAV